jgi:hypothetical protein
MAETAAAGQIFRTLDKGKLTTAQVDTCIVYYTVSVSLAPFVPLQIKL